MNGNLFVILSPLHLYIARKIIQNENLQNNIFIVSDVLSVNSLSVNEKIFFIKFPDIKDGFVSKIRKLLSIRLRECSIKCDRAFIPSDQNLAILLILKKLKFKQLNYFEEGGGIYYILNPSGWIKFIRNFLLGLVLGVRYVKKFLSFERIDKGYVFYTGLYESLLKERNIEFVDISQYFDQEIESDSDLLSYKYVDFLFLTQPLTMDGYCKNDIEVDALYQFLVWKKFNRVLIKLHPRDCQDRYNKVLKLNGVEMMSEKFNSTPYQVLHAKIQPLNIGSFFSSVLYTTKSTSENFARYALIKEINNPKINRLVSEYNRYIDLTVC